MRDCRHPTVAGRILFRPLSRGGWQGDFFNKKCGAYHETWEADTMEADMKEADREEADMLLRG